MATETFPFSVTFNSGSFEISQPTNGNTVVSFPLAQLVLKTHPSIANLYYFGTAFNVVTLDFTLCTNLTVVSRLLQIEAIISLVASAPLGAVTISGQPIQVNPIINRGEIYSLYASRSSSGTNLILRPNATNARLTHLSAATNAALSSGAAFYVRRGCTITGGAWAPSVDIPGSKMEVNTGGAVSAGTQEWFFILGTSSIVDISAFNSLYTTLQPIVIGCLQSGIGSTSVSVSWTEDP